MSKATWIWYPGDFEIWMRTQVEKKRQIRGLTHPPVWKLDAFYHNVKFRKWVQLEEAEEINLYVQGEYYVKIDGKYELKSYEKFMVPKGEHEIIVFVVNQASIPAIFMKGNTIVSDNTWEVSYYGSSWKNAASWNLDNSLEGPSKFHLPLRDMYPTYVKNKDNSLFIDFGKETFGLVRLENVTGRGNAALYYGESEEEAMACEEAETFDKIFIDNSEKSTITLKNTRAFRFVNIIYDEGIKIENVCGLNEYLPVEYKGKFKCSNETLNKIWDTAVYTLHLNTREFLLDGIKRDRWVWGGDALQSFLMNYYTFFDKDVNRRTLIALRGKDPVEIHINTIMDYTFYWFMTLNDYYLYTGDIDFIKQNYDKMLNLMDFCLKRRNENDMMEGLPGDWVFIDWADNMDKDGELASEQILLCRSLEVMAQFSRLLEDTNKSHEYEKLAVDLKEKIMNIFWDDEQGGFINNRVNGVINKSMTKHPSILAILTGLLDKEKVEQVKNKVILNTDLPEITTPYFRFFELDALCEIGEHEYVTKEMLAYWGGMLELGATSFWEEYKPNLTGSEHYAMYNRPFGKSLCHAWGASPVYILGKYYLGVRPLTPGYETYLVEPNLGGLQWIEGTVPMENGKVNIYMNAEQIKINSSSGRGYLRVRSSKEPQVLSGELRSIGENYYELVIEANREYIVKYYS